MRIHRKTPSRSGTYARRRARLLAASVASLLLAGCVYRIDIQQGNVVEEEAVEQVEVGMTRSQVQFLLGTPMVADTFHRNRWDYTYYLREGREDEVERRWFSVYFEDDRVVRLERNLEETPETSDS